MTFNDLNRPPLDEAALRAALIGTDSLWQDVEVTVETPSTNVALAERARAGAPGGSVLTTDHQSAGRGRMDRRWEAPPRSGLAVSVLLRPIDVPAARWVWLPLLVGLAVDATVNAAGVRSGLKWPNDVVVGDRKLAGILLERVDTSSGPAAIAGVGLNVTLTDEELPTAQATSLQLEGATSTDRSVLLRSYLRNLEALYRSWVASAGDPAAGIQESYVRRCVTIGRNVCVQNPDGTQTEGTAEAIDDFGRLVVGGIAISAGDVVHVRPTS